MSRSSIFSSDTLKLSNVPRAWLYSAIAAIGLFAVAEVGARVLMAPLGERVWTYWNKRAANKFEWYREQTDAGNPPQVLAVGDSTGAHNFDPASFAAGAGGDLDVYNMAWPANFPLPFAVTTLPALRDGPAPEVVILMQAATSFLSNPDVTRLEQGILSSVLGKRERGELVVADWLHLSRLQFAWPQLVQYWWRDDARFVQAPPRLGYQALIPLGEPSAEKLARQRQVEAENTVRLDAQLAERGFSADRRTSVIALAQLARERGFRLIVVLTPVRSRPMPSVFTAHRDWLVQQSEQLGFAVWDYLDDTSLQYEEFADGIHLHEPAVRELSRQLGERFHTEYR